MFLTLAHNLLRSRHSVTTFNSPICQLKRWFPHQTILPIPQDQTIFDSFDQIIAADHSIIAAATHLDDKLTVLKERQFDRSKTIVDNLAHFCRNRLHLPHFEKTNGITIPEGLIHKRYPKRVIIHPMCVEDKRIWPAEKFLALAHKLKDRGWDPIFAVSPKEREEWLDKSKPFDCPLFQTIDELATYVYESGAMIGNNSGTGHLSSNFNIPTLSIFSKKSYSRLWRPGFGPGKVVTPPSILIGGGLKLRYWKKFLTVAKVLRHFEKLISP
ncbi:MAG: hypothetical protein KR126chlam2_00232 [Chlamydiae bacterium]|nr:hypothetical protein [Chlamydiota bacterium]